MAIASSGRMSTYTHISGASDHERPKSGDSTKKDLWSSMLDSVASGKRLPEKNILVLGGSSDSQKEFLESLSLDESVQRAQRAQDRHSSRQPPIANSFALGYTYYDVLDADHEDILARLSLYLLGDPSPSFVTLLKPLLTPQTIPNTLVVILLDWSQPWLWLRELRDWICLLRALLLSLDDRCKKKMEEVMTSWQARGRGTAGFDGGAGNSVAEGEPALPLGPGEWDEALGLPICVVCQNSDQIDKLERERAWREEDFDFVLQFLRTVLLKHGASLIYTIPSIPSPLQALIHSSLGVHSLLKKHPLKHNVIDRDKVVLPPNWDSWGKIRVLREGFDVEGVNQGWSVDIEDLSLTAFTTGEPKEREPPSENQNDKPIGALILYEEAIQNPGIDLLSAPGVETRGLELDVKILDAQEFLASQLEALDRVRLGADLSSPEKTRESQGHSTLSRETGVGDHNNFIEEGRVNEHIGPVQFNMGGIQVDADNMLQRLKDRQNHQTLDPDVSSGVDADGKVQHEALASFFAGLMKRGGGSATSSPRPGAS